LSLRAIPTEVGRRGNLIVFLDKRGILYPDNYIMNKERGARVEDE
jgi:hypothetical protein